MRNLRAKKNIVTLVNTYVLENDYKIIFSLVFAIILSIIFYIYLFFMSVSYTYSIKASESELNDILVKLADKETELFKKEKEVEDKILATNFQKIDHIDYVNSSEVLVMNIHK